MFDRHTLDLKACGLPKIGSPFGFPPAKDSSILGSIWVPFGVYMGPSIYGKYHIDFGGAGPAEQFF